MKRAFYYIKYTKQKKTQNLQNNSINFPLTFRVVVIKPRFAAKRCPFLILVAQELVFGRRSRRVEGASAVRKFRRSIAKPGHGRGVHVSPQAEPVRKRRRKVRSFLRLVEREKGAVLQPRGVFRGPPAALRRES